MDDELHTGQPLTIAQAIAHLTGDDLGLRFYAAWWLGRFRVTDPQALDRLIAALEDEDDRTGDGGYPLRRNAARALGKLGDRRAVPKLVQCLECSDFYVREAAAQALEKLGDPAGIPALVRQLHRGLQEGQLLADQPDLDEPYDALLEALGRLGATTAIPVVEPFLQHPLARVRYSAHRAMYQLTNHPIYGDHLIEALQAQQLQLRRAALADLGAIGYLPAADAIAATLAENSLKLIALKGLLEKQIDLCELHTISPESIHVMNLMDQLL